MLFRSVRFQQVTGALLAKSHEDTAGFRWNAYLAANEVGADPDVATIEDAALQDWLQARAPSEMTLTSTHDTKRSEDARTRLMAISHRPDDFAALFERVRGLEGAEAVSANDLWYLAQVALAIWGEPEFETRLHDHMVKALREAKVITNWTYPDEEAEARVLDLVPALAADWARAGEPLDRLIALGEALSLCQTALKLAMPGIPDTYRGCEGAHIALTDPDNRRPVDLEALSALFEAEGFAGQKARLTRALLQVRAARPDLFGAAPVTVAREGRALVLRRHSDGGMLQVLCDPTGGVQAVGTLVEEALPGVRVDLIA